MATKWTLEEMKKSVLEVVSVMELGRMPSCSEVHNFYGNDALTNAISKKVGWYKLAQEMGLPIKETDTYFGKKQEEVAMEQLISLGYEVRRMPTRFPYDLLVNDCIKVDVKCSLLYRGTVGNFYSFYSFNLEKPFSTCDIYLLYLLNDDRTIKDALIVPSKFVPTNTQISVGETNSKYYRYSDRWDYVESYCSFLESVS